MEQEELEDGSACPVSLPDIKFGTWSRAAGLRRAPVRSVVDYAWLDGLGSLLLEAVKVQADGIPFPLRDSYELWLLDEARSMPLALLDSTCAEDARTVAGASIWRPGQVAEREFRSASLGSDGAARDGLSHGALVAAMIREAAGTIPKARWFRRLEDGGGVALDSNSDSGTRLHREASPRLMLKETWSEQREQYLVRDFLAWQAPWLLTLQRLPDDTGSGLEQVAFR